MKEFRTASLFSHDICMLHKKIPRLFNLICNVLTVKQHCFFRSIISDIHGRSSPIYQRGSHLSFHRHTGPYAPHPE